MVPIPGTRQQEIRYAYPNLWKMEMPNCGLDNLMRVLLPMSGMQQRNLCDCQRYSRGWARAIYESLGEADNEPCDTLKGAIISRQNMDTNEDRLAAHEQLSRRCYRERGESIDELARDIKKLLNWLSPGLPAEVHDSELRFQVPCLKKEGIYYTRSNKKGACRK